MDSYFYCQLGIVQRSEGQSAQQRSAYQSRSSVTLPNGTYVDYSDRGGHIKTLMSAPPGSPPWATDPREFWRRAAAAEKRWDAQEARLLEIPIPRGLSRADWSDLATKLVRVFVAKGMVVQADIHCTDASDGGENPHLHLMMSMRELENGGFAAKKARHWNEYFVGKAKTKAWRKIIATFLNEYCRRKGVPYQADPRSNMERGLPRAEACIPRWNFLFHKRTGKKTPFLEQRDREREARAKVVAIEKECAELERLLAAAANRDEVTSNSDLIIKTEDNEYGLAVRHSPRRSPMKTETAMPDHLACVDLYRGFEVGIATDLSSKPLEAEQQIEPDEPGGPPLSGFP